MYRRAFLVEPDCSSCPLRHCKRVPPEGDSEAKIALVGMGPGFVEVEQGRPFVGPSGQLLNQILDEAGLSRGDIWISNVASCMPEAIRIDGRYYNKKAAERSSMMEHCRSKILKELAIVKPKVIIAVGGLTMEALTDDRKGVTKLQGSLNSVSKLAGYEAIVIPVFHPAHLLRGEMRHYPQVLAGFKKAKRVALEGPKPPPGRLVLIDPTSPSVKADLALLERLTEEIEAGADCAIDVESNSKDPLEATLTVFGFALTSKSFGPLGVAVTVRVWDGQTFMMSWTPEQWFQINAFIQRVLIARSKKWFWNYTYDVTLLERHYEIWREGIRDGMIYHRLGQPDSLHSLDFVAHTELDIPPWKWIFRQLEKAGTATHHDLLVYNAQDDLYTLALAPILEAKAKAIGNAHIADHEHAIAEVMRRAHVRGIYIDLEEWRKVYCEHEQRRYAALERIKDAIRNTPGAEGNFNTYVLDKRARRKALSTGDDPDAELPAPTELPGQLALPKTKIKAVKQVHRLTADDFNPNSADHGTWFLYSFLRLPPTRFTKGGEEKDKTKQQPSSSYKGVLEHLKNPLVKAYVDRAEQEGKLRALEIVQKNLGPDGRLHPSWNSTSGTRFRSSPNVQNWDSVVKKITKLPKGRVFVAADAAAIEYRIAAYLAGIPELLALFNAPAFDEDSPTEGWKKYDARYDAHSLVATEVFGSFFTHADYRAVTPWDCKCGHHHPMTPDRCAKCRTPVGEKLETWECPWCKSRQEIGCTTCLACGKILAAWFEKTIHAPVCKVKSGLRTLVKRVVYALFYGAFPEKILASLLEDRRLPSAFRAMLNLARVEQVHEGFSRRFPEWDRWAREQELQVRLYGTQSFPPFNRVVPWALQALVEGTKIRNTPIQRAAGELVNIVILRVVGEIDRRGLDAQLVVHEHDALKIDCAEAIADEVKAIMNKHFDMVLSRKDLFDRVIKIHIYGQAKVGTSLADV